MVKRRNSGIIFFLLTKDGVTRTLELVSVCGLSRGHPSESPVTNVSRNGMLLDGRLLTVFELLR